MFLGCSRIAYDTPAYSCAHAKVIWNCLPTDIFDHTCLSTVIILSTASSQSAVVNPDSLILFGPVNTSFGPIAETQSLYHIW